MVLDGWIDEVRVRGKGGKTRVLLLTSEALRVIRACIAERHDNYSALFISHGRGHGQRLGRGTLWKVLKGAALALGLHESTTPHSFQHYRATQFLAEGMPLESVQAYLKHLTSRPGVPPTRILRPTCCAPYGCRYGLLLESGTCGDV